MTGYNATISSANIELTARDRIRLKDTSNAIKLDEVTQGSPLVIKPEYYVVLDIHNEQSESKDYNNYIVVDSDGNKYVTGSESFFTTLKGIMDEMADARETDYEIEIYRKDSKNYKGKQFITCSLV